MKRTALLFLATLLCAACSAGPDPQPVTTTESGLPGLADELPMDPGLTIGTLDNGLRYFIEPNQQPQKRAVLRLVVRAGSVLEDEDQLGLAHFVEHMAFNGTLHFPGNALVAQLESFGLRFGAHVNAHTAFDETVYKLQIPTDDPAMLAQALLILSDWAQGITFDPEEIERERGVTLEEWRTTRGAGGRTRDKLLPLTFHESLYKDRLPIGTEESLKSFKRDALVRYYRDWYRPELMAVVAVGDFDSEIVELLIKRHFGSLENPANPRPRPFPPIPDHEETLYGIVTDPEIPRTSVAMMIKVDDAEANTHGAYREFILEHLVQLMMDERLSDIAQQNNPPFIGAGSTSQRLTPTEGAYVIGAAAKEGQIDRALEAVLTEVERARIHGFAPFELERAKAKQQLILDTYYREKSTTDSNTHADEIIRHYTTGEPMPGIDYEFALGQRFLPEIGTAEANVLAKARFRSDSRVISVTMPEKAGLEVPSKEVLEAVVAAVANKKIDPPADKSVTGALVKALPEPGRIVSEKASADLGTTEWKLQNGVTVVLKPTDFRTDNLMFVGYSWGGHSQVPQEQFVAAMTASSLVGASGLGEHEASDIGKLLAGRKAGVIPWLSEVQEGIRGAASPEELELAFQLTYLIFTAPRFDGDAFSRIKEAQRQGLLNRLVTPAAVFSDAHTSLLWQDHPRYRPWTAETLEQMNLAASEKVYRARFANAGEFTFIFVGTFTLDQMRPLVQRYLGALPGDDRPPETPLDLNARRISGKHIKTVRAGLEPQASVQLTFHGEFTDTRTQRYAVHSLAEVLQVLMREELREALGGTYGVGVSASVQEAPVDRYELRIGFSCDPNRAEELTESAMGMIRLMQDAPLEGHYIAALQAQQRRAYETQLRDNSFWLGALAASYRRGEPPEDILALEELIQTLSPELVHAAAEKFLNEEQYVQVTLLPEETADPGAAPAPAAAPASAD